ncbi:MAG: glycosyltransferase [Nitrospiraceae bacterium]|nr:glycosyltransferase [Nitrospiraceae bacterium]
MDTQTITVVVCTYNRCGMLRDALESVVHQEPSNGFTYDVLVVDDGSTDDTAAVVKAAAQVASEVPVHYVHQAQSGVSAARNRGVAESTADWIAFFDDDQLASPTWLSNLLAVATEHQAKCVGGAILLDMPEECTPPLGPVCRSMLGEHPYRGAPAPARRRHLPSTGNLLVARKVFGEIGAFDPSLHSSEDTDFISRVIRSGIKTWSAPDAAVHHRIMPHRLRDGYFRWASSRWGMHLAMFDARNSGRAGLLLRCLGRVARSVTWHLPSMVFAWLRGDRCRTLDRRCQVWRTEGYARTALTLLAPSLFPQKDYLASLEFRRERSLFLSEPENS